jgi:hypothetical protein
LLVKKKNLPNKIRRRKEDAREKPEDARRKTGDVEIQKE